MSGALRQSFGATKRHLSGRVKKAEEFLNSSPPSTRDEWEKLGELGLEAKQLLEASINNLKQLDANWLSLLSSKVVGDEQSKTGTIREDEKLYKAATEDDDGLWTWMGKAEEMVAKVSVRLSRIEREVQKLAIGTSDSTNNGARSNVSTDRAGARTVKPPRLVLPEFSGDVMKWKQFWSIFKANIHDNSNLTGVEKFSYLVPQLRGPAKDAVDGLLIDDNNYIMAIEILKKRFDRSDERLIATLYSEFKKLSPTGKGYASTRKTYDACEKLFRQMMQAGEDVDASRTMSVEYLSKFHSSVFRNLERDYDVGAHTKVKDLREAMGKMLDKWETSIGILGDLQSIGSVSKEQRKDPRQRRDAEDTHSSALAAVGVDRVRKKFKCVFCGESHAMVKCERYPSGGGRKERLHELGRCIRCSGKHESKGCRFEQSVCFLCGQKGHLKLVCDSLKKSSAKAKGGTGSASSGKHQSGSKSGEKKQQHSTVEEDEEALSDLTFLSKEHLGRNALFCTAQAVARNPWSHEEARLRLVLDTLSGRSYITDEAARLLNLRDDRRDRIFVSVFGSKRQVEVPTSYTAIQIQLRDGTMKWVDVNTTKLISNTRVLPKVWPDAERDAVIELQKKGSLADNPFDRNGFVDVLIGADYAWDFVLGKSVPSVRNMSLIPTSLGFMLAGRIGKDGSKAGAISSNSRSTYTMLCLTETSCRYPSEMGYVSQDSGKEIRRAPDIDEFWKLETIGISDNIIADDDEEALRQFGESVKFTDGRYQVTWPWAVDKKELLPSNRGTAERRLRSLARRLRSDPKLFQSYRGTISEQVEKGVVEKVPDASKEGSSQNSLVHYLPHHPVVRMGKETTKLRVVYDASAKVKRTDVALNECLLKGPTILPDLCQLLIRFRTYPVAVVSDIEKAFLQVGLQVQDRDVTRFLWFLDDTKADASPGNIAEYRFCRVLFGVISSPFLLGATIQHHLHLENTAFAESLAGDVYVDNVISGLSDEKQVTAYYREVKAIFQRAGMNLRQFYSNSKRLMSIVPAQDKVSGSNEVSVLGLKWNGLSGDTLQISKAEAWDSRAEVTKRTVLQAIASLFDPIGFFQPVVFPAKLFLQELWLRKLGWDTPVSSEFADKWKMICGTIGPVFGCKIKRFAGALNDESTLAVFSDASVKGYGAVAYLCTTVAGTNRSSLIYARSRVAPLPEQRKKVTPKKVTIPRLELLGALTAIRMAKFCREALKKPNMRVDVFIDSMCVLHWIRVKDTISLKRFVGNRVDEIRKLDNCSFHYISTNENPADFVSRGKEAQNLVNLRLWFEGPSWLAETRDRWPENHFKEVSNETLREIETEKRSTTMIQVLTAVEYTVETPFGITPKDFSTWEKLINRTAVCLIVLNRIVWSRVSNIIQQKHQFLQTLFRGVSSSLPVQAEDFKAASEIWIRWMQAQYFRQVLEDLITGDKNSLVQQLGLRLDQDKLLRAYGRFENADLGDDVKSPILLSRKSAVTRLIVEDVHIQCGHSGVSHTLSQVRQRYWIPHGRTFVRKVLRECFYCRRFVSRRHLALPRMPPLPKERLKRTVPFQVIGLDYFGPIKVKVGDVVQKMWGCLLTCLVTRAVHLEPVFDCSTQEFAKALIRFTARRGFPRQIVSDNAAQFRLTAILANRAWGKIPNDANLLSFSAKHGISWKFIPELAPWQGGCYERLIGVVKKVLKVTIGRRLLTWTDLVTLLCEAEAIVNSRPITFVSADLDSQGKILRPVDFITEAPTDAGMTEAEFSGRDLGDAGKQLTAIWKQRRRHLDKMWQRWYDEYLSTLRERGGDQHRQGRDKISRSPREGEVVVVGDDDLPRGCWRLARVGKLVTSGDGRVRAAEIKFANGSITRRSVKFLIPLEIESNEPGDNVGGSEGGSENDFEGFSQEDILRTVQLLQQFNPDNN